LLVALHSNPTKSDVWAPDLVCHDGISMLWLNATHGFCVISFGSTSKAEKVGLLRVLGPAHIWDLGVGIVLVGDSIWVGTFHLAKVAHMPR
jgi:hypothetical protein